CTQILSGVHLAGCGKVHSKQTAGYGLTVHQTYLSKSFYRTERFTLTIAYTPPNRSNKMITPAVIC
ncbi:MAG: hypothetical protein IKB25_00370, partial [Lentisphaeria bacterium]|nr:hypothetical protein [Lentisphaeria bacterium]